jgi:hypothetical protein
VWNPMEYVLGFFFDQSLEQVLLILKKNGPFPNLWNGIGGHIEVKENSRMAMYREFVEETGLDWCLITHMECISMDYFPQEQVKLFVYGGLLSISGNTSKCYTPEGVTVWLPWVLSKGKSYNKWAGCGNVPYYIQHARQHMKEYKAGVGKVK